MNNIFDQLSGANPSDARAETADKQSAINKVPESETNQTQSSHSEALFYERKIKIVTQELIKFGLLEASNKSRQYQTCLHHQETINTILAPLDLQLKIDDTRGLAFLIIPLKDELEHNDAWQHPLVRRQRMNLEQSLMVAILRQHYLAHEQDAGTGALKAIAHLDDLLPQLNQFLGASGSDERDEKRLRNLLDQLKSYALVSEVDDNDKIIIRPLIAHLNNPEHLQGLIAELKQRLIKQDETDNESR
jgi:hypothetical protein